MRRFLSACGAPALPPVAPPARFSMTVDGPELISRLLATAAAGVEWQWSIPFVGSGLFTLPNVDLFLTADLRTDPDANRAATMTYDLQVGGTRFVPDGASAVSLVLPPANTNDNQLLAATIPLPGGDTWIKFVMQGDGGQTAGARGFVDSLTLIIREAP